MACPPQDIVTTARCSETTAAKSTTLAATSDIEVQRTSHRNISQQAGYDEHMPAEHSLCYRGNSQQISDKPDDVMNNESRNKFSNANITDNGDTDPAKTGDALYAARTLSPRATDRKTFVVEGRECASEASTSPSSLIDAKYSKNQGNKVRYKYINQRCPHQNCRRAKTLPRK